MTVLVCGDRNWSSLAAIRRRLRALPPDTVVIEGEARGADTLARVAAQELGFRVRKFPARWSEYGRAAGPIRNQQMLDAGPDLVLAFHADLAHSKGTADMVRRATKAGLPVRVYTR